MGDSAAVQKIVDQRNPAISNSTESWSVEGVLSGIINPPLKTTPAPISPIPFFHLLERLKTTPREGWRRFSIDNGESIADHMYRMSIITMMAPASLSSRLNIPRCTKMALVHDMAESLVGDITPVDGVNKMEKNRRESETMSFITKQMLGSIGDGGKEGESIRAIWQEYEDNMTLEAKFVHDVDKLELILQMVEYEKRHDGKIDLGEFVWVSKNIVTFEVKKWCAEVLQEREDYWQLKAQGREIGGLDLGTDLLRLVKEGDEN